MSNNKNSLNTDVSNELYFLAHLLSISLAILMTIFLFLFLNFLPQKLPLFYSLAWGDNQLVSRQQFLIIPGSLTLISLVNLIISWQLHSSQSFLKNILLLSSLVITIILTVTFLKIVFIFI